MMLIMVMMMMIIINKNRDRCGNTNGEKRHEKGRTKAIKMQRLCGEIFFYPVAFSYNNNNNIMSKYKNISWTK